MFPRVKTMIKSFKDFTEVNAFLATNNCVVRSIDPGVTKIYVEIEEAGTADATTSNKLGNPESIIQEIINLKLVETSYGVPYYDKYNGRALVDYLRSYRNADTLLAVVIANLKCSVGEGTNLRRYLANEEYDTFYVK